MQSTPSSVTVEATAPSGSPASVGHPPGHDSTTPCQLRELLTMDDVSIWTIDCDGGDGRWFAAPVWKWPAIVLVRTGRFARCINGRTAIVDATQGYVQNAGDAEMIQHLGAGHRCTMITVHPDALPTLWRPRERLMASEFRTTPATDLAHRRLVSDCRRGDDAATVAHLALSLVADLFESCMRAPRLVHRRGTAAATRRVVDIARGLATSSGRPLSLQTVATAASVSPHHLTRTFKEHTGMTMGRYRNRVRVRLALEWIADGDEDFTRIAHDLGFADHAHFSRTVMAEVGVQPRTLRRMLCAPDLSAAGA